MDGWVSGWVGGWVSGWMGEWVSGWWVFVCFVSDLFTTNVSSSGFYYF